MFKNYLTTALRTISRHKLFTAINVLGLSLGICTCIVIYIIVNYELSFDRSHPGNERIYRVMGDVTESTGDKLHYARIPLPVSQTVRKEIPGIEMVAAIIPYNLKISVPQGSNSSRQFSSKAEDSYFTTTAIAEPQYFSIFNYNWLAGNATTLESPFTVVLTASRAKKYFGNESMDKLIGRQVIYDDSLRVNVSGIINDPVENTDLVFTDFISFPTIQSSFLKNSISTSGWSQGDMTTWTFAKLYKDKNTKDISTQLASLIKKNGDAKTKLSLWLEPLTDIHFNSDVIENPIRTAHKPTLYGLIAIASFILALAVINFINLSTAQSAHRTKETSVRKILGSGSITLIFRFLTETFVITFCAALIAIALIKPVLYGFSSFIPKAISFHILAPSTISILITATFTTTILAGLYPAKMLSSFLPVSILNGKGSERGGKQWLLRKSLIVFQFTVAIVFIIGSFVIAQQLDYTRKKDLGFTADAIITIETPRGDSLSKINVFAEKVKQVAGVNKTALQWLSPMTENSRGMKLKFKSTDEKEVGVTQVAGNEDFIPLYQIRLLAGRNLVKSDTVNEFVINENLARKMGNKTAADAIGKILYWNDKPYPVVGVVADFHSTSFHDPITPLCIINRANREGSVAVKIASKGKNAGIVKKAISQIEKAWKEVYPAGTFSYKFYDESLAMLYEKDRQTATLMNVSMAITIFISCIGLFGLALFTAEKRAKEISIRKILGATVTDIVFMLSKEFVVLIFIAFLIASPVAWYFMNKWLQGFAYRIDISVWLFITSGLMAVLIALITVGLQALRAAVATPVKSLRTE